jgi:RimJ/RimL family protein N-acetyltransferase
MQTPASNDRSFGARIETERLILRPIDPERDFDPWARTMADPGTVRYLGTEPMDTAQSWRNMAVVLGHWQMRGYGFFSVVSKKSGDWLGRVGPWFPEGWPAPEVGWTIAPWARGRGFATEAASAAITYAFERLDWDRVVHVILDGNEASMAVARKVGSELIEKQHGLPGVTEDTVLIFGQARR